jgi:hypothetical protein
MKKTLATLILAALTLLGTSAFILKNSTGKQGYAGSPGEGACDNCHNGGSSAASGITITSAPAFSVNINSETEYMPDSLYTITIGMQAAGFSKYGLASQILNNSNTNAGVLKNAGAGVTFLNSGAKRTAVQNSVKSAAGVAAFTYKWKAPSSGDATIYAIGNAVNGTGGTGGDFVIAPTSLALVAAPTPTTITVGLKENHNLISQINIFPNPANDLSTISYFLTESKTISIQLIDISGRLVKLLSESIETAGMHSQIIDVNTVASGVYFIKITSGGEKLSQKLITVY